MTTDVNDTTRTASPRGIHHQDGTVTHDHTAIRYALTKGAECLRGAGFNESATILEDMVAGRTEWRGGK